MKAAYNSRMESSSTPSRVAFGLLLFFAATSTASIAAQNTLWVAVLIWFLGRVKSRSTVPWPRGLFPLALGLFLIPFFTSSALGIHPSQSFQTVFKYLTFLMVFYISAMEIKTPEIQKLLWFFVAGSVVCGLDGIWKFYWKIEDRITSFSGYFMIFGGLLMCALLIQVYFLTKNPRKPLYWACALVLLTALLLNQTRGAWIGFAVGFLVLAWFQNRRLVLAGLLVALAGFFLLPSEIQNRVKSIGDWQDQPRQQIWATGIKIIKDYPIVGIGQGNLSDLYPQYRVPGIGEANQPHLHNNFLQIQVQNGIFGSAAYLFLIFAFFYSAWRYQPPSEEAAELNRLLACLFGAALVWGLTEYTFSHQFMYFQTFLLGLQCGLWNQASALPTLAPKKKIKTRPGRIPSRNHRG